MKDNRKFFLIVIAILAVSTLALTACIFALTYNKGESAPYIVDREQQSLAEGSVSEIDELRNQLLEAESKNILQQGIIENLNKQLEEEKENNLTQGGVTAERRVVEAYWLGNWELLYVSEQGSERILSVCRKDGTAEELFRDYNINNVDISPDNSKIIFNDFEFETNATVRSYDSKKKKLSVLEMPKLPQSTTVASMAWLDNRYFLMTVQFDTGTVVRGGDVWLYDTETNEYKPIIVNSDPLFQTVDFTVNRKGESAFDADYVMFNSALYEETVNTAENRHHLLSIGEIIELFNNNKTLDLSKTAAMK